MDYCWGWRGGEGVGKTRHKLWCAGQRGRGAQSWELGEPDLFSPRWGQRRAVSAAPLRPVPVCVRLQAGGLAGRLAGHTDEVSEQLLMGK